MFGLKKKPNDARILTLRVNTPEGQAQKNIPVIKMSILRFCKGTAELETPHSIIIKVKCRNENVMNQIVKRAGNFESSIKLIWGKFAIKAVGNKDQKAQVKDMVENHTSVEVLGFKKIGVDEL
jgi:hypothetical protein